MPSVIFLDAPEFRPFIDALDRQGGHERTAAVGYVAFEKAEPIEIRRADTGLDEAVWFGGLVAGFSGEMEIFDEEILRIR